MKKRTAFEVALVRRVSKKSDFVRYAAYEMDLELLRRKRVQRLGTVINASENVIFLLVQSIDIQAIASVSDYSLVRRQFQIFERALRKFKNDIALWIQYIEVAKREGAASLVSRVTARSVFHRLFIITSPKIAVELCNSIRTIPLFTFWLHLTSCISTHRVLQDHCSSGEFA